MNRSAAVALALLLLVSGCSAAVEPSPQAVGEGGVAAASTESGDAVTERRSPYGGRTLVVAVENDDPSRPVEPLVREALAYWEANSTRYAGYAVDYRLDPDAADPDLVVAFVEDIERCGRGNSHAAGCAPFIAKPSQFDPPERIRVEGRFSNASTVQVLKHELGHTLGLSHDDAPLDVMRARSVLTTLPAEDARNQSFAWAERDLSVYLDATGVPATDRATVETQVEATLAFYERGAEGSGPGVSFSLTRNRSAADVVLSVGGDAPCARERGSCRRIRGADPDGDGRLERFNRMDVYVVGLDPAAVGWHVGRHVGFALSLDREVEYPEPLRADATYAERRSEWWE